MKKSQRNILQDESGQEPTVMKILVGIILVSLGLGIGVSLYQQFGEEIQDFGFTVEFPQHQNGEITMSPGENEWITVKAAGELDMGEGKNVKLSANPGVLEVEWFQDNSNVKIGNSTEMKIIVDENTPTREDPYPIVVEGNSEGNNASKTLYVKVE